MPINRRYSEKEASVIYNVKMVVCSNGFIKIREYEKGLKKIKDGYEPEKKEIKISGKKESNKEFTDRSLAKTRDKLIEYASENASEFKSFITLTFKENVKDLDIANKEFHRWVSKTKRKYPKFIYLGVPEFQKRGAVHYHVLTNLVCGKEIEKRDIKKTYNKEKDTWYEMEYYNIPFWSKGFSSAFDLSLTDEHFNVALYITKYLYKDIDNRLWGRKKILRSNNLKEPDMYYLSDKSEIYKDAMNYIKEKDYLINEFTFTPKDSYQIGFKSKTMFLSQSDCNTVKKALQSEYHERGKK